MSDKSAEERRPIKLPAELLEMVWEVQHEQRRKTGRKENYGEILLAAMRQFIQSQDKQTRAARPVEAIPEQLIRAMDKAGIAPEDRGEALYQNWLEKSNEKKIADYNSNTTIRGEMALQCIQVSEPTSSGVLGELVASEGDDPEALALAVLVRSWSNRHDHVQSSSGYSDLADLLKRSTDLRRIAASENAAGERAASGADDADATGSPSPRHQRADRRDRRSARKRKAS